MKSAFLRPLPLLIAASLAACATGGGGDRGGTGGVEVARFHLGMAEPMAKPNIAIEAFDRADANRPEFPAYASAVARELTRLGWTVVPTTMQSEQIAMIDLEQ